MLLQSQVIKAITEAEGTPDAKVSAKAEGEAEEVSENQDYLGRIFVRFGAFFFGSSGCKIPIKGRFLYLSR